MAFRNPDNKNFHTRGLLKVEHATIGKEEYKAHPSPAPSPKRKGFDTVPYSKAAKIKAQKPQRDLYDYTKGVSKDPDKDSLQSRDAQALRKAHIKDLETKGINPNV